MFCYAKLGDDDSHTSNLYLGHSILQSSAIDIREECTHVRVQGICICLFFLIKKDL